MALHPYLRLPEPALLQAGQHPGHRSCCWSTSAHSPDPGSTATPWAPTHPTPVTSPPWRQPQAGPITKKIPLSHDIPRGRKKYQVVPADFATKDPSSPQHHCGHPQPWSSRSPAIFTNTAPSWQSCIEPNTEASPEPEPLLQPSHTLSPTHRWRSFHTKTSLSSMKEVTAPSKTQTSEQGYKKHKKSEKRDTSTEHNLSCCQLKRDCYIYKKVHVSLMVTTRQKNL